jgi:hypothetical protein
MEQALEKTLEIIRGHIRVLNHSSERMVKLLDEVEDELSDLGARVAAIEANMGWLMRLIWVILGGIIMIVFRVFAPDA